MPMSTTRCTLLSLHSLTGVPNRPRRHHNAMLEMDVLTMLILALVGSLFLLCKPHVGSSIVRE
jgi:hypothetical protein